MSSKGFEATIVSPNMLFGGGGAKFCCGMPIDGVSLFAFDVGGGAVNKTNTFASNKTFGK